MLDLAITFDYELFGNGSGDVFEHMIKPTNTILNLLDQYNAKSTIFFEVVEYWKIKEEYEKGNYMGYQQNPIEAIEKQLKNAYAKGHDIQLHLHPQWINAKFKDGNWDVDELYWRTSDVPVNPTSEFPLGLERLIENGRKTIEDLIQQVNPEFKCNIFRAGGYNIMPSEHVLQALRNQGFIADSSVFPKGYSDAGLSRYDYSEVSNKIPYWFCQDSVLNETNEKVEKPAFLELPIYAESLPRYRKYDLSRIKAAFKNKNNSINKIKNKIERKNLFQKIHYFLEFEAITWDFCLFDKRKMRQYIKNTSEIAGSSQYSFHPFILVGHPKDLCSEDSFIYLLEKNTGGAFLTLSEIVRKIKMD